MSIQRKSVFISYAHKDRAWADELLSFMAPWIREKRVGLWDDSLIKAGANWKNEINQAIRQASVAVLLVTKDFLASEFIMEHELPRILKKAKKREIRIIWVAVGSAAYDMSVLNSYQAANNPKKPLETMKKARRNKSLLNVARKIGDALTVSNLASSLELIDDTTEPLEAIVNQRPEEFDRNFRVEAVYVPSNDQIKFTGTSTTITAEDIDKLPDDDREYIADLEEGLRKHYGKLQKVKKTLGNVGGVHDDEINVELLRISKLMCRDLNDILDFLVQIHKAELEDHYGRYRHICGRLAAI